MLTGLPIKPDDWVIDGPTRSGLRTRIESYCCSFVEKDKPMLRDLFSGIAREGGPLEALDSHSPILQACVLQDFAISAQDPIGLNRQGS